MKIIYVNGYGGKNSSKPEVLGKILDLKIKHFKVDYGDIPDLAELKTADVIIASSTGSYLARAVCEDNNIPLVSLNPIINLESLISTFSKLGVDVPVLPTPGNSLIDEIIFITSDDELISAENTIKSAKSDNIVVVEHGGHRFQDLEIIKPKLLEFLKFLYIA